MNNLATILVLMVYMLGPIYIGWTITIPKVSLTPETTGINILFIGAFVIFFGVGVLLRYHLGIK